MHPSEPAIKRGEAGDGRGGGEHWAIVIKSVYFESMLYLCLNSLRSVMFLLQGVCLCLYLCVSLSVCLSV